MTSKRKRYRLKAYLFTVRCIEQVWYDDSQQSDDRSFGLYVLAMGVGIRI